MSGDTEPRAHCICQVSERTFCQCFDICLSSHDAATRRVCKTCCLLWASIQSNHDAGPGRGLWGGKYLAARDRLRLGPPVRLAATQQEGPPGLPHHLPAIATMQANRQTRPGRTCSITTPTYEDPHRGSWPLATNHPTWMQFPQPAATSSSTCWMPQGRLYQFFAWSLDRMRALAHMKPR